MPSLIASRCNASVSSCANTCAIASVIPDVDIVLVMSVWPGFGGQKFIETSLAKLQQIRALLRADQRLEIDGGVGADTIAAAKTAGADTFVAGSAIFGTPDPAAAMARLLALARG